MAEVEFGRVTTQVCPLCSSISVGFMTIARGRDQAPGDIRYQRCGGCESVFMSAADRLPLDEERKRYGAHENESDQEGYLNYLEPLRSRVVASEASGARGLDFGCGPNPVLAESLRREGLVMDLYDPTFGPLSLAEDAVYDFVVATEVIEHFHAPRVEFQRLFDLVKPGGSLWLMTQMWREDLDFRKWHYRRDPTHVFFYSEKSLEWIREKLGFSAVERPEARVIRFVR